MPLIEPVAECRMFNALKRPAQWFYLQLKTKLDPLGRTDGHPAIINSALFPLRKDVRDTDIAHWLHECELVGLLRCYTDKRGRAVVQVHDAIQRLSARNMRSDFDPPDGQPDMFPENTPQKIFDAPYKNGNEEKGKRAQRTIHTERSSCAGSSPDLETKNTNSQLPSSNSHLRSPNFSAPIVRIRREMWQLLSDEAAITDRIKSELKKEDRADRPLIESLKQSREKIREEMKATTSC